MLSTISALSLSAESAASARPARNDECAMGLPPGVFVLVFSLSALLSERNEENESNKRNNDYNAPLPLKG